MRKLLFVAAMFAFVGTATAQEKIQKNKPQIEFNTNFDQWAKAVNLTAEQKSQIEKIDAETKEARKALRKNGTKQDFQKINQQKEEKINAVLTPEQRKQAEAYKLKLDQDKAAKATKSSSQSKRK